MHVNEENNIAGEHALVYTDTHACKRGKQPFQLTSLADQFLRGWEDLEHTPAQIHLHVNKENIMNWRP